MKLNISELNTIQVDWALGQIDPRCEGLKWSVIDGTIVGISNEDSVFPENVAVYIHAGNFMKNTKLKRIFVYADHYNPSSNWQQSGRFINEWKPTITWPEPNVCRTTLLIDGDLFTSDGPDVLTALLHTKLRAHLGEHIDIPDDIYEASQPLTAALAPSL